MAPTRKCVANKAQISPKRGRGRPRNPPKNEALPTKMSPPTNAKSAKIHAQSRKPKKTEPRSGYYKGVAFVPNAVTSLQTVAENILMECGELSKTLPIIAKQKKKAIFEIKRGSSLAAPTSEVSASVRKVNTEVKKAVAETPVAEIQCHPLVNIVTECSDQYKFSLKAMSGLNSTVDDDLVRLNVGGKIFVTAKSMLPESFHARLVNRGLSNKKDESSVYFVDGDPEHFRTNLTCLPKGDLNLDDNEKATKDLLCEAVHDNIEPLVNENRKAMRPANSRTEMVLVSSHSGSRNVGQDYVNYIGSFSMSERREDYEVLKALQQNVTIKTDNSYEHFLIDHNDARLNIDAWVNLELSLRNFGFMKEEISDKEYIKANYNWKYIRTIHQ